MATVPSPSTIPETPVLNPGGVPDEVTTPTPDTDFPDPGDPTSPADRAVEDGPEAHSH